MDLFFLILSGILAGGFASILGIGGGILIVPLLSLIFGLGMHTAIGTSLLCVIATSMGATPYYIQEGLTNIRLGMNLELSTTLGAIIGGSLAGILKSETLSAIFGILLFYIAFYMLLKKSDPSVFSGEAGRFSNYKVKNIPLGMGICFFAGNFSGLLGVGGGFLKVPTMHFPMGIPLKNAVATGNFMVSITACAGALIYYFRGDINPTVAAPTIIGVLIGSFLGSRLIYQLKAELIKKIFIALLLYSALRMLFLGFDFHFFIF